MKNTCNVVVCSPKGFVITNAPMGESFGADSLSQNLSSSKDIWQWTLWVCRFLPTALKQVCPMIRAGLNTYATTWTTSLAKTVNIPKITILRCLRVSPGQAHSRTAKTLPTNHDQGQVWTRTQAYHCRENSDLGQSGFIPVATRVGDWAVECLDGTLSRVWSKTLKKL